jgi:phosphoesterase RecJ-like protein
VLNIDHHLGNTHYGAQNWVDTSAPALGEMIHRLARKLNVALDPETATCLYLTLVTDTGGFRFANATTEAFAAAAELVREGAVPEKVSEWVYDSRPESSIRLLAEMLRSLEVHAGGRLATALLSTDMFARAGATTADAEGLIDVPRSIDGVAAVAVIRQLSEHEQKVSLRSRGGIDVQKIALQHGGGGHRNAAGYAASGRPEEVRAAVAAELEAELAPA